MHERLHACGHRDNRADQRGSTGAIFGWSRGYVCVLIAVALAAFLGLTPLVFSGGGGVAGAQSQNNGNGAGHYSLTIHKFDGEPQSQHMGAGANDAQANGLLQPLGGIKFQINQLEGLDVKDQSQLSALVQSDPQLLTNQSKYPLGPELTAVTGADGKAKFDGLAQGVYLVREQPSRVGNVRYSVATPFLVAVPDATGNDDVVVRAKNQPIVATKNIIAGEPGTPEAEQIAEEHKRGEVRYRLESTLPAPDVRGKLYQFIFADPLDHRLEFKGVTNGLVANGEKTVTLREGADYRVETQDAPQSGGYPYADKTVKITLTEQGLKTAANMRESHPEARVVFDMLVLLKPGIPAGETVSNTAQVFPDGHDYWIALPTMPPEWHIESNEVGFLVGAPDRVPSNPEDQLPVNPGEWPEWILHPMFPLPPGAENHPVPAGRQQCPNCGRGLSGSDQNGAGDSYPGSQSGSRADRHTDNGGLRDDLSKMIERLPMTGAHVVWWVVAGFALLLLGFFLVAWRRRRKEEEGAHEPCDLETAQDPEESNHA